MELDEMRRILEEIARESKNPNARVSAIRALKKLAEDEEEKEPSENPFDKVDEMMGRRAFRELYDGVKPRRSGA